MPANTKKPVAKAAAKKTAPTPAKKVPLWKANPRNFSIGQSAPPTRDLTRFVKWPRYVKLQRQRRVLYHRLKTPPAINQFTHTIDVNTAKNLFSLLNKYRPEDAATKKTRLATAAKAGGKQDASKKPLFVKYGINHITQLVESKEAKLVIIAHDVDPIEIVVWLPALCRLKEVPFLIVKGKSRLGEVVHKKTATALALTEVRKEDVAALNNLVSYSTDNFNNNKDVLRQWGGGKVGRKSAAVIAHRQKTIARDEKRKGDLAEEKAKKSKTAKKSEA